MATTAQISSHTAQEGLNPDGSRTLIVTDAHVGFGSTPTVDEVRGSIVETSMTESLGLSSFGLEINTKVRTKETTFNGFTIKDTFRATVAEVTTRRSGHDSTTIIGDPEINVVRVLPTTETRKVFISADMPANMGEEQSATTYGARYPVPQTIAPSSSAIGTKNVLTMAAIATLAGTLVSSLLHKGAPEKKAEILPPPPAPQVQKAPEVFSLPVGERIQRQLDADNFKGMRIAGHNIERELTSAEKQRNNRLVVARLGDAAYLEFNGPGHTAESRKKGAVLYSEAAQVAEENDLHNPNAESARRSVEFLQKTQYKTELAEK